MFAIYLLNHYISVHWYYIYTQVRLWQHVSTVNVHLQANRDHFNPLNAELNPICHLLALLGAHHIFHVSGLRFKLQWSEHSMRSLLYLINVLHYPEDDRLRSKHVATMWPECMYYVSVLIYCCVLAGYNILYKFVTAQLVGLGQIDNFMAK